MTGLRFLSALLLFSGMLGAQSFQRGTVVIDFNTGLEAYETTSTYTQTGGDTVVTWFTGNSNVSLGMEAGLGKRFGIGLRGKASSFYRELDKVTDSRSDILTKDLTFIVNFHPINRKHFDFILGSEIGLSKLHIDVNNLANSRIVGQGGYYALYMNPRFYLGRFGFNVKTYLPFVNYRNLLAESSDPASYMLSQWKGAGFGISLGVQMRFF